MWYLGLSGELLQLIRKGVFALFELFARMLSKYIAIVE